MDVTVGRAIPETSLEYVELSSPLALKAFTPTYHVVASGTVSVAEVDVTVAVFVYWRLEVPQYTR
jgi:hypothetical protein